MICRAAGRGRLCDRCLAACPPLVTADPSVRKAIAQVIDGLASDPRPPGFLPLTGHRPYLRVRSGDYRVIYTVDDSARVVTIAAVRHRREIYRRLGL